MGKNKYIETPEKLLELFSAYIKDIKSKPYLKHDFVGKDGDSVYRKLEQPLSWVGFECYLSENEIIGDLSSYEQNRDDSYKDYLPIIARIKRFIENDQFSGAVVGIYKENIIARKLGLADKQDVKHDIYDITLKL